MNNCCSLVFALQIYTLKTHYLENNNLAVTGNCKVA